MTKQKKQPLSYEQAADIYFGGVKRLATLSLPFLCKRCKTTQTKLRRKDGGTWEYYDEPIMNVAAIFKHIRKTHEEIIL